MGPSLGRIQAWFRWFGRIPEILFQNVGNHVFENLIFQNLPGGACTRTILQTPLDLILDPPLQVELI